MKIYWTAFLSFLTFLTFAQTPINNIEKDITLANQYHKKATYLYEGKEMKLAFQYALKGRLYANENSILHHKITTQAILLGCASGEFDLVDTLIIDLTNCLETNKGNKSKEYWLNIYTKLATNLDELAKEIKGFERPENEYNENLVATLKVLLFSKLTIYKLDASDRSFKGCFRVFEKLKAIQLLKILSPEPIAKNDYSAQKRLVKDILHNRKRLELVTKKSQKDSIQFYQNALTDAIQTLEEYLGTVEVNFTDGVSTFSHVKHLLLEEIQKELSEKTLFIEYMNVKSIKKQFIITIGQSQKNIYESDGTNLITNLKRLDELIQDRFAFQKPIRNEFIDISHNLYKTLIEPIETELEGKTELMIVLEGQLFHLPFELLLKSNEKKPYKELDFLIKKYEFNYHYSATTFFKLKKKVTVKDKSLLAFAPVFFKGNKMTKGTRSLDFMVDSVYRSIENFEFVTLPNTKKEVKVIAKLVRLNNGKTTVLLSKNATKKKLNQQLESHPYQFIHLATHSIVNYKNPKYSALACYSKDETMDNLLYANEIQFKKINADLVVLSSCESGIGQLVAGEGLIALNRSFIYSGTKNVMFSLWKVSDKYSSELMIDFYKNYFKNPSYTSALRQAKLKMLKDPTSAQPRFWSAFVLMGE